MSKRWLAVVESTDEIKIEDVKVMLDAMFGVVRLEPVEAFPYADKMVMNRREPRGRTYEGQPRNVVVTCRRCERGDCSGCLYPLACPCVNPVHNTGGKAGTFKWLPLMEAVPR